MSYRTYGFRLGQRSWPKLKGTSVSDLRTHIKTLLSELRERFNARAIPPAMTQHRETWCSPDAELGCTVPRCPTCPLLAIGRL